MKVICKCCLRPFDYDMYMGLCPECGRVYRREKGMYSEVEKDMVGDFHLHADDGGLNRGIDGVVYNQPGSVAEKSKKNGFDEDYMDRHFKSGSHRPANTTPTNNRSVNNKPANNRPVNNSTANSIPEVYVDRAALIEKQKQSSGGYYAPNHKTQMNKEVMKSKKNSSGLGVIFWIIMIIIGYLIATQN